MLPQMMPLPWLAVFFSSLIVLWAVVVFTSSNLSSLSGSPMVSVSTGSLPLVW